MNSCATSKILKEGRQRRAPDKIITQCQELFDALIGREQFYTSLRGTAILNVQNADPETVELNLAIATPIFMRAEVDGPLGIRMGLLQINDEWVYFYDTRKKLVRRLPTKEFSKEGLRRQVFLRELPVSLPDPFVIDAALSRSGLVDDLSIRDEVSKNYCPYLKREMVYELVYKEDSELNNLERWHRVWIDGKDLFPIKHLTRLAPKSKRQVQALGRAFWETAIEWEMDYSYFSGEGTATLPRRMLVKNRSSKVFSFEWRSAEPIKDRDATLFQWRPSASLRVQDY